MATKRKIPRKAAREAARPVAGRKRRAEPVSTYDDGGQGEQCKAGRHPVNRRLGSACAACGSLTAWKG